MRMKMVKMRISENMRMFMNMRIRVISSLQSMKPFWTMSQMSTLDGSPKLERQVEKLPKISTPHIVQKPKFNTPFCSKNCPKAQPLSGSEAGTAGCPKDGSNLSGRIFLHHPQYHHKGHFSSCYVSYVYNYKSLQRQRYFFRCLE